MGNVGLLHQEHLSPIKLLILGEHFIIYFQRLEELYYILIDHFYSEELIIRIQAPKQKLQYLNVLCFLEKIIISLISYSTSLVIQYSAYIISFYTKSVTSNLALILMPLGCLVYLTYFKDYLADNMVLLNKSDAANLVCVLYNVVKQII